MLEDYFIKPETVDRPSVMTVTFSFRSADRVFRSVTSRPACQLMRPWDRRSRSARSGGKLEAYQSAWRRGPDIVCPGATAGN